jgi:GTP pyrophosphokinase
MVENMISYYSDEGQNLKIRAWLFAHKAHENQKDDSGCPYFQAHCSVVGDVIREFTDDAEVIAAAYLHDVLEDTNVKPEELERLFGKRVKDLVVELTHEGNPDSYGYYFPNLKSRDAILIKFIDRASNLSRMDVWEKDKQEHYLRKSKFWKDRPYREVRK